LGTQALNIFERLGDKWEVAHCLALLGQTLYGDAERSIDYFEQSLDLYREIGDRRSQAAVLRRLAARTAVTSGNLEAAREWVEESLTICEEVGSAQEGAHALLEYGKILRRQNHTAQAVEALEEALKRLQQFGDLRCTVRALTALGIARIEGEDPVGASDVLHQSLELGRTLGQAQPSRVALAGIARLLASEGRLAEAATLYGFVDKLGRDLDVPVTTASRIKRDKLTDSLRVSMGQAEFDRSWQDGQTMSLDEAIAIAFGDHVT
jgi:tetratricopeptide (TPR) repeat protein